MIRMLIENVRLYLARRRWRRSKYKLRVARPLAAFQNFP